MKNLLAALMVFLGLQMYGQAVDRNMDRPKLVVGIMVDQMRQEYLYRYYSKYAEGGFKRMMSDGFVIRNGHYNYASTSTGPGHASVYTGTTPSMHGIIGNDWYDKDLKKEVNCVNDPGQKPVGVPDGNGDVSPWRMLSSTVTDELKLFTQQKSKVIGISIKDRGAVLPAGHMADAAYWFDNRTGKFITSTYYMDKLPAWVDKFNALKLPDQYLSQEWKTFYPIEQYTESGPDDSPYERKLQGKDRPTFPYDLKAMRKTDEGYSLLRYLPFGNDYLTEMAKAALEGEKLGQGAATDFLAISYSPTDELGHAVGPNAIELEDMYIRLDRNIADLLKTLDARLGAGEYTVFLTSDHGVADVAQYLKDQRMPAGYVSSGHLKATLNEYLGQYFDREVIEAVDGDRIFLNHDAFRQDPKASGVDLLVATELVTNFLMAQEGIASVYPESVLRQGRHDEEGIKGMVIRTYHPKRSGDILMSPQSGWYASGSIQGTTHGSPYRYDTHVPMLFFGHGIRKGSSVRYHSITDLAPTISVLLNIKFPSGSTGQPIEELFEQ